MSPLRVEAEPRDNELRMALDAMSSMLGRRLFIKSGCCSVLEREPVDEIEPLEPVERFPLFHDFNIDLRALDFSDAGSGADIGECCWGGVEGGRLACCEAGRLRETGGGGEGERITGLTG